MSEDTAAKLAAEALSRSEARLRLALDSGRIIVWERDPASGAVTRSANACEITGLKEGSAEDFARHVHPDDRPRHDEANAALMREGRPYEVEVRFLRPDGECIWLRNRAELQIDSHGRRRVVGTSIDITEWRRLEAELRAGEERYRALVSASAATLWRADREGSIIHALGWGELTGQDDRAALGAGWLDSVLPEDRERTTAAWRVSLETGHPVDVRYRVRRRDGVYRWMVARAVPLRRPDGTIREWVGTLFDIHEHRLAAEAVSRSEARYRLLAENSTDMIERTDLAGLCQYISPACREVLGQEPEALIGTYLTALVHADDFASVSSGLDDLLAGRADHLTAIFRCRHRDGRWVWLEARRRLVRDAGGAPAEITSVIRDITERAELEDRLRQSQKMEAIGQLTGGMAHDFNNLLTVIIGNAEVLAEDVAEPDLKRLARTTLETAERGAALNQQLLAFARRQSLKPEPVALDAVVAGMMPMLERTLGEHIEIRTELSGTRLAALTDRTLLESALLNLAVNARDAMPGGGMLTITTGEGLAGFRSGDIPAGQEIVFVRVSDTGTGMPPEVLEHAFEPFFTTKEVGKGSGLGLSMVYGFAQQTGGHVSIESRPGQGTCVTIMLRAMAGFGEREAADPGQQIHRGRGRILLVEDEAGVRDFAQAQLESLGYDVSVAATGPEALALLREDRFDLLFTDVVLPQGMSGAELAERARRLKPDLKVLLTSGYSEEVFQHHGRPDGDIRLLRKPYRRKELAGAVRLSLNIGP